MARANPMRGEAEFGGHKLIVNFNAWCVAEASTGETTDQLLQAATAGMLGFRTLRALIRAFLDVDMSLEDVGNLIDEIGIKEAGEALGAALVGYRPGPKKEDVENPRKAA